MCLGRRRGEMHLRSRRVGWCGRAGGEGLSVVLVGGGCAMLSAVEVDALLSTLLWPLSLCLY